MKKRSRYILITICLVVFFSLVPIMVFYIRGIKYDSGNYLQTGILSVRSDPKGAQVFLGDTPVGNTPADIRFLKPGEYSVRVEQSGYQPWTKRTEVFPGKVTWASPDSGKVYLFLSRPTAVPIAEGVLDFYKLPSGWLYLTAKDLVLTTDDGGKQVENIRLPKQVSKIIPSPDGNFFILEGGKNYLLFDQSAKKITDLSQGLKDSGPVKFDRAGDILFLKNGNLVQIDAPTVRQHVLFRNVAAFAVEGDNLYYLQNNTKGAGGSLFISTFNSAGSVQRIAENVPLGTNTELLVTGRKEIFFLEDQNLYRLNNTVQKLSDGVLKWNYDPLRQSLVFISGGELSFYDFPSHRPKLITRSASDFFNPILDTATGQVFYLQGNKLIAAELDAQDHQNSYELASLSGSGRATKFSLDKNSRKIYLLDNGKLQILTIR